MPRRAALTLLILTALAVGRPDADAQEKPKQDPDKLFKFADTNKDGKLSRAEFTRLLEKNPRFADNPRAIDLVFDYLDADMDGFLTLAEFRNVTKLPQPKDKGKGKDKPAMKEMPETPEGIAFFEKKIRPVLVAKCLECHSAEKGKTRGDLALDTRSGLRAGSEHGPIIVPGKPQESTLVKALHHKGDHKMPPKEKLSDQVVADFEQWVKMGAPDPRTGAKAVKSLIDVEKGRQFWAFQRPKAVAPPAVKDKQFARDDVDRYLLASLEAKGLKPVGDADRRTLLRRVYFDLIGLPPTPEAVEAFAKSDSPKAFEAVVDKLLASPRFGERWGRHWLDVARFAETSGRQVNFNYPHAWRYRDWVIEAFNDDKPYDRFVTEQLAGDLLPSSDAKQKAEQLIATGFLAVGPRSHNERNLNQFDYDQIDEQIDTTSQAFLGLTVACARCHDHKFDPVPQADYYALAGIFRSTQTKFGTVRLIQNVHYTDLFPLGEESGQPAGIAKATPEQRATIQKQITALEKERDQFRKDGKLQLTLEGVILNARLALTQAQLDRYDDKGNPKSFAMGVRDLPKPKDSPLLNRGEVEKPGDVVPRGFVQVVSKTPPRITGGSGRLQLAEWLTKDNPLTARVMVNRTWLHLFGRGLVASPDNFGTTGQAPTHPALLDHLALAFEKDWSVKKLIRRLVLSRAYQLASTHDDTNHEVDPDNALVWRMSKRRLEAEPLRDAMLAVAGVLDLTPPKGSAVAMAGDGPSQILTRVGAIDAKLAYRTVYLPVVRDNQFDSTSLFDFPDASVVVGERATTTVPAQSLYLLNNPFVVKMADAAAARLFKESGEDRALLRTAYLRFLGRPPTAQETKTAEDFLASYPKLLEKDGIPARSRRGATWSALCQALFACAEFSYRD